MQESFLSGGQRPCCWKGPVRPPSPCQRHPQEHLHGQTAAVPDSFLNRPLKPAAGDPSLLQMAMLIKSLSWHTHPHPFPSQLAPRAGPQARLPAQTVAIPSGARRSILPEAGLLGQGHIAWCTSLPWVSGKGSFSVPSMDRAMHPRQELVSTASRLRAGTGNAPSARWSPQERCPSNAAHRVCAHPAHSQAAGLLGRDVAWGPLLPQRRGKASDTPAPGVHWHLHPHLPAQDQGVGELQPHQAGQVCCWST